MKIYKVFQGFTSDGNQGYSYHGSKALADKALKECEDNEIKDGEIEIIEVTPTKAGIILALNIHGSHNDNG